MLGIPLPEIIVLWVYWFLVCLVCGFLVFGFLVADFRLSWFLVFEVSEFQSCKDSNIFIVCLDDIGSIIPNCRFMLSGRY